MLFHMRLPRNKKEFALFIAIISVLSVNIIAPLITCFEFGFSLDVWADVLTVLPFIWLAVVALVLITYKPIEWLTQKFAKDNASYSCYLLANIVFTVFFLSIFLTVIGTWIGSRSITLEPIRLFFYKWPRNFAISLFVEACIAQPIARFVMNAMHVRMDAKKATALPESQT